jgi:HAD superfamily, subfamily IIIB (Acid phosphatase)
MTRLHPSARLTKRALPIGVASVAAALAALTLSLPGSAGADRAASPAAVPAPPAVPTSADQIQNIDQVKTAIKGYYGDTVTNQIDPVDNTIDHTDALLHTFSPTSSYANEMAGIVAKAEKYLKKPNPGDHPTTRAKKAVLFDVDDTSLNTYNYEIYSNFVYNPTTNAAFVNAAVFPAVPGMVGLEKYAESKGYAVFFLTGRPESQRAGTVANLTDVGFDVNAANLYLKDVTSPLLAPCGGSKCTTIQYKSAYRAYIESLGYDIVANFGDQYSDLLGGYSDKTFKLPNPMYYLP